MQYKIHIICIGIAKKKDIPSKALIADVVLATGAGAKAAADAIVAAMIADFIMVISCSSREDNKLCR